MIVCFIPSLYALQHCPLCQTEVQDEWSMIRRTPCAVNVSCRRIWKSQINYLHPSVYCLIAYLLENCNYKFLLCLLCVFLLWLVALLMKCITLWALTRARLIRKILLLWKDGYLARIKYINAYIQVFIALISHPFRYHNENKKYN